MMDLKQRCVEVIRCNANPTVTRDVSMRYFAHIETEAVAQALIDAGLCVVPVGEWVSVEKELPEDGLITQVQSDCGWMEAMYVDNEQQGIGWLGWDEIDGKWSATIAIVSHWLKLNPAAIPTNGEGVQHGSK